GPNCFEHYNPFTGTPCTYRGVDDYQHSWVVDLIVKYVAGLQPDGSDTLTMDPLPFPISRFALEGVRYRGRTIDVHWDELSGGLTVNVDGYQRAQCPNRRRMTVDLSETECESSG